MFRTTLYEVIPSALRRASGVFTRHASGMESVIDYPEKAGFYGRLGSVHTHVPRQTAHLETVANFCLRNQTGCRPVCVDAETGASRP
jgi:hypothetical protein